MSDHAPSVAAPLSPEEEATWRGWLDNGHDPSGTHAIQGDRMRRLFATLDALRAESVAAPLDVETEIRELREVHRILGTYEHGGYPDPAEVQQRLADRLEIALAAAPPALDATLDPDRLAEALFDTERPGDWPTWTDYIGAFGSAGVPPWRRKAERLIAAYGRAATPASGEPNR